MPVYWLHGPRQFCKVDGEDPPGTQAPDQAAANDCVGSQLIVASTVGSLVLRYNPILSFNDRSDAAHTSADESSSRASSIRNSVRNLVIAINRQSFTAGICLPSALVKSFRKSKSILCDGGCFVSIWAVATPGQTFRSFSFAFGLYRETVIYFVLQRTVSFFRTLVSINFERNAFCPNFWNMASF